MGVVLVEGEFGVGMKVVRHAYQEIASVIDGRAYAGFEIIKLGHGGETSAPRPLHVHRQCLRFNADYDVGGWCQLLSVEADA